MHIYLKSGEMKCFYENLAIGNLLIGDLDTSVEKNGIFEEDHKVQVTLTIDETFDNDQRVLNQRNPYTGDFTFTALETGEHRICVTPEYSDYSARIRLFIDLEINHISVLDSKKKDDMDFLKNRVNQLIQRLGNVRTEQDVIREKEALFRNQSESANGKIVFWSILQIVFLAGACAFQLHYLKNFFVKQKVI